MTAAIALRPDLELTVGAFRANRDFERSATTTTDLSLDRISVTPDRIRLGDAEVPTTEGGLLALAEHLAVPAPFFKRVGKDVGLDFQSDLVNRIMGSMPNAAVRVEYGGGGLVEVRQPSTSRVVPNQVLDVAATVFGEDAPVQRVVDNSAEFSLDLHVPFGGDRGIGGDAQSLVDVPGELLSYSWNTHTALDGTQQVGDVTAAGARFTLDLKRGLAPSVTPWSMRLACTNGMETVSNGTKIDARGLSVEEVLAELEAAARVAFANAEGNISHFYDLRNQRVDNPERAIRAIARERGIPDRSMVQILDMIPAEGVLPENPTQFDIVNLVTNLANRPSIRNNGGRLLLERAGGAVIADHALRCSHCQHALSN
jgi:hypothetical protein